MIIMLMRRRPYRASSFTFALAVAIASTSSAFAFSSGVVRWSILLNKNPTKAFRRHRGIPVVRSLAVRSDDPEEPQASLDEGSVLGASLLFAGTAIGAGMLALPAETAPAGFVPSVTSLFACWMFTVITSLVTLEASWTVSRMQGNQAGFLSISKTALGTVGEAVTAILFWFLLTAIVVAYTSEGGQLISQALHEFSSIDMAPAIGSAIFMAFFASLGVFGTERVDSVNRFLVAGLVGSFLALVGVSLPGISMENLFRADWTSVYPQVISIGILSFGAQNTVPTLLQYLGGDAVRTRRAILIGSLIPLVMYSLWEAVFLGVVPFQGTMDGDDAGSKMQVVSALGDVGGVVVKDLVEVFSACAIGSSMAGASVSLVDFFQDALATKTSSSEIIEKDANETIGSMGFRSSRLVAAALALGPPLGLACAYPDAFLVALEDAGLIGGVSLYGVLPALAVLQLRRGGPSQEDGTGGNEPPSVTVMPGRLMGGVPALYVIAAVSAALIVPEFVHLGSGLLQ